MPKRVLSVGQCFADHGSISRVLARHFDVEVVPADSAEEALALLRREQFNLVLVNRVLDAGGAPGLEIIKQIKADSVLQAVPVMLVSNHDDAQHEAVRVGAAPGFGKAALGEPQMLARLRAILS
jgi:DNA-binding NarL/FixJ family response regulator